MKLTKQLKAEIADVYEAFWGALFYADIEMYSLFLDEDYRLIGTTEQEFFFSKAKAVRFLKATADQLAGNLERRNSRHKIEIIENLVFITDQFDAYVLIDDKWSFYEKTRVTTLLHEKNDGWKIIQQHFSFPDNKAGSGQTIGLEKIAKENLHLKEAIRRRTIELELKNKELEIEFSLERVRAVAMGMKQPDDMLEVCEVIARELISLGIEHIRNIQTAVIDVEKETYQNYEYYQVAREKLVTTVAYKEHPTIHAFVKRMVKDPEGFYARRMIGDGLKKWLKYQAKAGQFVDPTSKKAASLHYYFYSIGSGALGITTYAPLSKEAIGLFKRFRNVFQLAYARFVDIQQAEEQAKEARVQLAMERVRARTMAMQGSDELPVAANLLFQQVQSLGMPAWSAGYCIWDDNKQGVTLWMSSEGVMQPAFHAPLTKDPSFMHMREAFEQGRDFHVEEVGGKALVTHYKYMRTLPVVGEVLDSIIAAGHPLPDYQIFHCVYFSHGFLLFITYEPVPEAHAIFRRFGNVFDQTYTRFLDLQKAESQTREAQIEAALERVRSRTMGMHKSEELAETVSILFKQLIGSGIELSKLRTCGIATFREAEPSGDVFMSDVNGDIISDSFKFRYDEAPSYKAVYEAWKKGEELLVLHLTGKPLVEHFTYVRKYSGVTNFNLARIGSEIREIYFHVLFFSKGYLFVVSYEPIVEHHVTLKRFGALFQQTYTRFLDLQKAEAQAREAQIEAALERVRSRSMAMHKSDELKEVIRVVLAQFIHLNIKAEHAGFYIDYKAQEDMHIWLADPNLEPFFAVIPYFDTPTWNSFLEAKTKGIDLHTDLLDFKTKNKFYKSLFELFKVPEEAKQFYLKCKGLAVSTVLLDNVGLYIENFSAIPYTDQENEILMRFGKVFQQTYTRFLDLQKAEAQTREAQIEVALERVRSRSMAMHKSEELADLSLELVKQVQALGVATWFCAFNIKDDELQGSLEWGSNGQGTFPTYRTPREGVFLRYYEAGQKGETLLINEIGEAECPAHYEYLCTLPGLGEQLLGMKNAGIAFPVSQIDHVAFFKYGYIIFITYKAVPESHDIFVRFARIFEQTYTRFLDLKKAEAQAKEAQIEAALEKVRSRTMAMQSSNELQETAAVLFNEFKKLGTDNVYQVTIGIYNEEEGLIDFRVTSWAGSGAQENRSFKLDMNEPTVLKPAVDAWKANKKSLVIDLAGEALEGWLNYRNKMSGVAVSSADTAGRRVITVAYYSKGHLSISTPVPVPTETQRILERFAAVFDSTYTRFLDLKKAEAQALRAEQDLMAIKEAKQNAEEALAELQTTQKQLIQAEKMASLGELTAGIAHEIQNPLNFVNNFSEVSNELISEMVDEVDKGNTEEVKAIARDVQQNLEKILHHGKRADGIVKGMLQHSRSSSGVKEPTDINALADEYLRLAYHGLRAKDKSFNATLKTEFDDTIGSISVIPQDIGRVILNLITNAFYAAPLPPKGGFSDPDYVHVPTIWVSTKRGEGKVIISVRDNGPGIPAEIRDKIFQPFFTTKPTGQGTGLGLSLSYDIVKAHGGELKVETKDGEGSEFIIVLPI